VRNVFNDFCMSYNQVIFLCDTLHLKIQFFVWIILGLPETHTAKSEKHTKYRNAHNFGFEVSKS
jgi:hypothetical protein